MSTKRIRYSAQFRFQLVLEAAQGLKTMNEMASEHGVHPTQISEWKRQLLAVGETLFNRHEACQHREQREQEVELYEDIGRLNIELEWLEKKLPDSGEAKRFMIGLAISHISIRRQCDLTFPVRPQGLVSGAKWPGAA